MTPEEFKKRKAFAKELIEKRHLTAMEIGMILWETQCEHCYYREGVTSCEDKDCALGVKIKANHDFKGFYNFREHREVGGE